MNLILFFKKNLLLSHFISKKSRCFVVSELVLQLSMPVEVQPTANFMILQFPLSASMD